MKRDTLTMKRNILTEEQKIGIIFILPPLIYVCLLYLKPLLETFWLSFCYKNLLRPNLGAVFSGIENYLWMFSYPAFWASLLRTFVFTVGTGVFSIVIGLLIALLMNFDFPGKPLAFALLLLPWLVSDMVASFIFTWIFDLRSGILNYILVDLLHLLKNPQMWLGQPVLAMISTIAVSTWKFLPFTILVLGSALKQVSPALVDAARIDGANRWEIFINTTLPSIKAPLLVLIIFRFAVLFRLFEGIFLLTRGGPGDATKVLSIWYYQEGFEAFQIGHAAAIAVLMTVITFAFFLIVTKTGKEEAL